MIILSPGDADPEPKKRGRPPAVDRHTSISAWIPVRHYDRLTELASAREASLSKLVAEAVQHLIRRRPPRV